MPATEITSDIDIVNAALAGLAMDPITDFTDNTEPAKLANATYRQVLEEVLVEHPWNFAMTHATLDMAIKPTPAWRWDYAYTPPADSLRIWEVEDQGADEGEEWTISDELLLTNLSQTVTNLFSTDDVDTGADTITVEAHGLTAGDAVVVTDAGGGLPNPLTVDTVYYVLVSNVDTIQLETTPSGGAINITTQGGTGNAVVKRTIDVRYVKFVGTESKYSTQFIAALIARLQAEWAEALVKATTLGERLDMKHERKLATARSIDGQEGTPERQDTSTWIDAR